MDRLQAGREGPDDRVADGGDIGRRDLGIGRPVARARSAATQRRSASGSPSERSGMSASATLAAGPQELEFARCSGRLGTRLCRRSPPRRRSVLRRPAGGFLWKRTISLGRAWHSSKIALSSATARARSQPMPTSRAGRAGVALERHRHDHRSRLVRLQREGAHFDAERACSAAAPMPPVKPRSGISILGGRQPVHPGDQQRVALDQLVQAAQHGRLRLAPAARPFDVDRREEILARAATGTPDRPARPAARLRARRAIRRR